MGAAGSRDFPRLRSDGRRAAVAQGNDLPVRIRQDVRAFVLPRLLLRAPARVSQPAIPASSSWISPSLRTGEAVVDQEHGSPQRPECRFSDHRGCECRRLKLADTRIRAPCACGSWDTRSAAGSNAAWRRPKPCRSAVAAWRGYFQGRPWRDISGTGSRPCAHSWQGWKMPGSKRARGFAAWMLKKYGKRDALRRVGLRKNAPESPSERRFSSAVYRIIQKKGIA